MSVQLGINGFGRIGRLLFRAAVANPQKFRVLAINDLNEIDYLVYLLKYDSAHGKSQGDRIRKCDDVSHRHKLCRKGGTHSISSKDGKTHE